VRKAVAEDAVICCGTDNRLACCALEAPPDGLDAIELVGERPRIVGIEHHEIDHGARRAATIT